MADDLNSLENMAENTPESAQEQHRPVTVLDPRGKAIVALTKTRWLPGRSGNPKGRPKGRHVTTVAVREAATELVDNPDYRAALFKRMLDGTAGPMEPLMWFYAKGKPREQQADAGDDRFKGVTNEELRQRLIDVMSKL